MPFRSERQRRFLHAKHPDIAERWEKKERSLKASMPGRAGYPEDEPRPLAEFSHAELEHLMLNPDSLTPEGRAQLSRELERRVEENPDLMLPPEMHYDATGGDKNHPMYGLAEIDYTNYDPDWQDKLTGEPMDLAMRLLKQGLELQPPIRQGVEETPPIQEDIPTVNTDTMSGGGNCCEKVRQWLLRGLKPESEGYNQIMNASCEEIKSGQVGSTKFLYDKVAEFMGCSEGFDSGFQNINTGEPMDLAWRLLKFQTTLPQFDPTK